MSRYTELEQNVIDILGFDPNSSNQALTTAELPVTTFEDARLFELCDLKEDPNFDSVFFQATIMSGGLGDIRRY